MKNKLAPPFRSVEFEIIYGRGVCKAGEVMSAALEDGMITQNGTWFALGDEKLGQGRETVREKLRADDALMERVLAMVTPHAADAK